MNDIEQIITSAMPHIFPAAALTVHAKGQVLINHAWGDSKPDSLFDLASLTKLFTVTAFLVVARNTSLETPLADILPEFGSVNPRSINGGQDPHTKAHLKTPPDFVGSYIDPLDVTLWHLLTHTSGVPAWRDVYNTSPVPPPPHQPDTIPRAERWRRGFVQMCRYAFVNAVGVQVIYSDIGMMLLQEVIARLNNTDFETAINQHVIQPLGIKHTVFNPVSTHGIDLERIIPTEYDATWRERRAWGEVHDENACGLGGVAGHAGLFGTAADVAVFAQAWLTRSIFDIRTDLWGQATTKQAQTGAHVHGLGWMLPSAVDSSAGDLMSRTAFGHTGFTGTSLWIDPERELVVSLMTNRVYVGRDKPGIHAVRRAVHDAIIRSIG